MKPANEMAFNDMNAGPRWNGMTEVLVGPVQPNVGVYEGAVPWFAADALDRLYGSIYATLDQFRLDDALASANTYVAREHGDIKTLLLFRRDGPVVTVLNQMIRLDGQEIKRFADTIFMRYSSASAIVFQAIRTATLRLRFPVQRFHCAEDIVAPLPNSRQAYLSSLGKNLREAVQRYGRKIERTFPTFAFHTCVDGAIDERQMMELHRLHQARMHTKNDVSNVTEKQMRRFVALARQRGLATVATIDGRVCGGLLCWRVGPRYFMRMIAHDPQYDDVKLGTVCCYRTIGECIERGGRSFHFLGGRLLYKYRFGGVEEDFDRIVIYRSHAAWLRLARLACRTAAQGAKREFLLWLENAERRDDAVSRLAARLLQRWRRFKGISTERFVQRRP